MTAPTPMVYYHLRLFSKEGGGGNYATGTIPTDSLTEAYVQEARVICAIAIGPITKLAALFS